jgi:hypothetical protein
VIVDPDFLDHWRTRMLVDTLKDEAAALYVLRIWGHCQQRKADRFVGMPAAGLRALCKATCPPEELEQALVACGFVVREGDSIFIPKWAEYNASLLAAWENGAKGGRPRKPEQNPRETHGKPTANPDGTQTKPIRVDKRREEENTPAGFARFWSVWPASARKEAKGKCLEAWQKADAELRADLIVAHVERLKRSPGWTKDGGQFIPAPLVYLRNRRWEGADSAQDDDPYDLRRAA